MRVQQPLCQGLGPLPVPIATPDLARASLLLYELFHTVYTLLLKPWQKGAQCFPLITTINKTQSSNSVLLYFNDFLDGVSPP